MLYPKLTCVRIQCKLIGIAMTKQVKQRVVKYNSLPFFKYVGTKFL